MKCLKKHIRLHRIISDCTDSRFVFPTGFWCEIIEHGLFFRNPDDTSTFGRYHLSYEVKKLMYANSHCPSKCCRLEKRKIATSFQKSIIYRNISENFFKLQLKFLNQNLRDHFLVIRCWKHLHFNWSWSLKIEFKNFQDCTIHFSIENVNYLFIYLQFIIGVLEWNIFIVKNIVSPYATFYIWKQWLKFNRGGARH